MEIAGWLLIIGMLGLFISSDIILFKTIKDQKKYSLKTCYAVAIVGYSIIAWVLLLSLMCILTMAFNHIYIINGVEIPYSVWEYIYGILLLLIPISQTIVATIGTIKYTVSILNKKWWHPLMAIGISAGGFCFVFAIVSRFL